MLNPRAPNGELCLQDLQYNVYLGWSEEERKKSRLINVTLYIRYPKLPVASETDELEDANCYASLNEKIKQFLEGKSFRLIEYLTYQVYQYLKQDLSKDLQIKVQVSKHPQIENLKGDASFICSDWT